MKIAVLSDSHNYATSIEAVKRYIESADMVLFLGDGESDIERITKGFTGDVYAVSGNCDFGHKYPQERIVNVLGKKIYMCHGHKYGVNYGLNSIYYRGREVEADIVLFGHTHIPIVEEIGGVMLMNPGSISLGRGIKQKTMGYIYIEEKRPIEAYIEEILI